MHWDCCIYRAAFHRCTAKRDKKLHFFSPKKLLQLQSNATDRRTRLTYVVLPLHPAGGEEDWGLPVGVRLIP